MFKYCFILDVPKLKLKHFKYLVGNDAHYGSFYQAGKYLSKQDMAFVNLDYMGPLQTCHLIWLPAAVCRLLCKKGNIENSIGILCSISKFLEHNGCITIF